MIYLKNKKKMSIMNLTNLQKKNHYNIQSINDKFSGSDISDDEKTQDYLNNDLSDEENKEIIQINDNNLEEKKDSNLLYDQNIIFYNDVFFLKSDSSNINDDILYSDDDLPLFRGNIRPS